MGARKESIRAAVGIYEKQSRSANRKNMPWRKSPCVVYDTKNALSPAGGIEAWVGGAIDAGSVSCAIVWAVCGERSGGAGAYTVMQGSAKFERSRPGNDCIVKARPATDQS